MKKKSSDTQKKKLSETQAKIMDFVKDHPDSTPEIMMEGTSLPKITVYSCLKSLVTMNVLTMVKQGELKNYRITEGSSSELVENDTTTRKAVVKTFNDNHQEVKKTMQKPEEPLEAAASAVVKNSKSSRDFSSYKFEGEIFKKGALARAIIQKFVKDHRNTTYAKLEEIFPPTIVPTYSVFAELSVAKKRSAEKQRYFIQPDQQIKLKDKTICVTNQWTSEYINRFLTEAKKQGYKITSA